MLKRFSNFVASVLLVLMPMQVLAAANLQVCNSIMQMQTITENSKASASEMPCHKQTKDFKNQEHSKHKDSQSTCKTNCTAFCASLNNFMGFSQNVEIWPNLAASKAPAIGNNFYVSFKPPSLQRPPIFLT